VSQKKPDAAALIRKVQLRWPIPRPPKRGDTLLEQGLVLVLTRHMSQVQAEASVAALQSAYADWNEARVSQVQELAGHLRTASRKQGFERLRENEIAANAVREYLQEIFQKTHGLDLAFLLDDASASGKWLAQMPFLGFTTGSYLLWFAKEAELPVHTSMVRVLDRMGLLHRTSSIKKARDLVERIIPNGKTLEFLGAVNEVADLWCDTRKPLCHMCPLVEDCQHGRKVFREWKAQQARLDAQRQREERRRLLQEKKDEERARREEERAKKRAEAEAKRRARELERKRRADAAVKKKAAAQKAAARKAATRQKAEAKKADAKKKAEARRKATASRRKTSGRKSKTRSRATSAKGTKSGSRPNTTRRKPTKKTRRR